MIVSSFNDLLSNVSTLGQRRYRSGWVVAIMKYMMQSGINGRVKNCHDIH